MYENMVREKFNIPNHHKLKPTNEVKKFYYDEFDDKGNFIDRYMVIVEDGPFSKDQHILKLPRNTDDVWEI